MKKKNDGVILPPAIPQSGDFFAGSILVAKQQAKRHGYVLVNLLFLNILCSISDTVSPTNALDSRSREPSEPIKAHLFLFKRNDVI